MEGKVGVGGALAKWPRTMRLIHLGIVHIRWVEGLCKAMVGDKNGTTENETDVSGQHFRSNDWRTLNKIPLSQD